MVKLSGVVIVTGAASGLGRESAGYFAECGARVLAVDINQAGLAEIASDRIEPFVADIARGEACAAAARRAAEMGPVTGLLNSAGIERHGSVVDMAEDEWDRVMDVNLKAIFLLSKHVIPLMIANGGGSVVNMSSIQAIATQAGVAAYAATKGAVLSLTRVMRSITAGTTSGSRRSARGRSIRPSRKPMHDTGIPRTRKRCLLNGDRSTR